MSWALLRWCAVGVLAPGLLTVGLSDASLECWLGPLYAIWAFGSGAAVWITLEGWMSHRRRCERREGTESSECREGRRGGGQRDRQGKRQGAHPGQMVAQPAAQPAAQPVVQPAVQPAAQRGDRQGSGWRAGWLLAAGLVAVVPAVVIVSPLGLRVLAGVRAAEGDLDPALVEIPPPVEIPGLVATSWAVFAVLSCGTLWASAVLASRRTTGHPEGP